jgi:CheY-like chemotaxis protein
MQLDFQHGGLLIIVSGNRRIIMPSREISVPVLNVDDYAPSRFLRSRILERAGYEVHEAETAEQAVARCLSGQPPELVLLDIALPDGDGFTVCEKVKAASGDIPIVMITSVYRGAQARRDGFAAGADEYLLEPIEPERLVASVRRFLDPSRLGTPPATLVTDPTGQILSANAAAGRLLNLSGRSMVDWSLLAFFASSRDRLTANMRRASEGHTVQDTVSIRPRNRKPFDVRLNISPASFERGGALEWHIEPIDPTSSE